MFPVLQVGSLAIQTPGLILILGLWLGLTLGERHARSFGITADQLYNIVFISLASGILGARLAYVARFPGAFTASPIGLLSLNTGLLDPFGGLVIGILVGIIYGQRKKLPLLEVLDGITPVLAVLSIAVSLSNLASGNGFGAPSSLPWAIELWGASRHPSQVYETIAALLILSVLWPGRQKGDRPGTYFFQYLALSAIARLFLEGFRGDSTLIFNGFRVVQILSWGVLALSLWGLWMASHREIKELAAVKDLPRRAPSKKSNRKRRKK